jgi:SAM-dependent methyltransferase
VGYLERVFRATEAENRRVILGAMIPRPGAVLADLGCADGRWTLAVAQHVGAAHAIGVEHVPELIGHARRNGLDVREADLSRGLPLDDASVDVVHSNQVIEHLADTDGFLAEIRRVLRPDGYAVISTNNLASWHNVVSLALGWQPFPSHVSDRVFVGNPLNFERGPVGLGDLPGQTHLRVFTGRALAELAAHHGLDAELQTTAGFYPLPPRVARAATRVDGRHGAFLVQRLRPGAQA